MTKSINDIPKKKVGRPATGKGLGVLVRLQPAHLKALDGWITKQVDRPTRPQAIRRLVELGLKAAGASKPAGKTGRKSRAAELAANTIEKLIDPSASSEQRAQRRRRLTKGPTEFREDRVDLPKVKK
jgi:hypothetical protein